jgi:hypothetical protein
VPLLLAGFSAPEFAGRSMTWLGRKTDAAALEGHPVPPLRGITGRRTLIAQALGLIAALLLLLAPTAFAEPPANDKFEDAKELTGSLPIEVSSTNMEATKEEGESVSTFAAGHSVWFEWEATSTGFVTIGGCESDIDAVLGVFTGTAVGSLVKVADTNPSEGPHCPFAQREYTFKAVSGTTYAIGVDGNGFHFPEGPQPVAEGDITLRIEETPPPVNDDFADATTLVTTLEEEFEGEAFYFGSRFGHNWNATEEGGEPDHAGGPHGASVWYSWTAPVSGEVKISAGFFSDLRMGLYRGSSLGGLETLFSGLGPAGGASFMAQVGTSYRIAIYGLLDSSSSEVEMRSFQFNISMRVPVPVSSGSGRQDASPAPAGDTTPPDTKIRRHVLKRRSPGWSFRFESTEPNSTFECKLDKRPFAKCGSSRSFKRPKVGPHTLKVRAVDPSGNVDRWPAVAHFSAPGKPAKAHATH